MLSSYGTSGEPSREAAGSRESCSISCGSADNKQRQQQQYAAQQQQQKVLPLRVQSAQGGLNSMLLQDPQQQQLSNSSSNSCHATASSAGTCEGIGMQVVVLEAAAVPEAAAVDADSSGRKAPTAAAVATTAAPPASDPAAWQPSGHPEIEVEAEASGGGGSDESAHTTQQQQQDQQEQVDLKRAGTGSSSGGSSAVPPHLHLHKLESGSSFRMTDPLLSGSSNTATAISAMHSTNSTPFGTAVELASSGGSGASFNTSLNIPSMPTTATAAAAAAAGTRTFSPFSKAAQSQFAQLSLQQSVATALLSKQQQYAEGYSVPAMRQLSANSAAPSFMSAPGGAAAAAAAGGRGSSSGSGSGSSSAPALAAAATGTAGGASGPVTPGSVAPKPSRVSWAASSITLAAEPQVFEILDPETSSVDSSLRILRHSASATSLSSSTEGAPRTGSKTAKGKLQQLRMAVSMSWDLGDSGASAAGGAGAAGSSGSSSKGGLKSILRRSTESVAAASLKSSASGFRRSKSAHSNVMLQQQQQQLQVSAEGDVGSEPDQVAAAMAAVGGSSELLRSLPPLPPSSSGAGSTQVMGSTQVVGSSSGAVARTFTAAAVAGSVASFASGNSAFAGGSVAGQLPSTSSSRLASNVQAAAAFDSQSTCSSTGISSTASLGAAGSSGSLVALAVNRMQSVRSAPLLSTPQASGSSTSSSTSGSTTLQGHGSTSALSSMSGTTTKSTAAQGSTGSILAAAGGSSSSSSCGSVQVATVFAEAFLAALAAGNTKWGSDPAVAQLFYEAAKMMGLDKQLYIGKTVIIRRLNSGMDQLVKMVAANAPDSAHSKDGSSAGAAGTTGGTTTAAITDLASSMAKPLLSVSCPDPKAKPTFVVAVYTFKWGIRKFALKDEFIVKQGQIMRLRRTRG